MENQANGEQAVDVARVSIVDCRKGYVYKKNSMGQRKKRFAEVNGNFLTIFTNVKQDQIIAAVDLSQAGDVTYKEVSEKNSVFYEIELDIQSSTRKFTFITKTSEEAKFWTGLLEKTRDKAKLNSAKKSGKPYISHIPHGLLLWFSGYINLKNCYLWYSKPIHEVDSQSNRQPH